MQRNAAVVPGGTDVGGSEMNSEGKRKTPAELGFFGAGNEIRTRDFNLGKVTLYH